MFGWIKNLLPKNTVYEPELKWTTTKLTAGHLAKNALAISKAFKDLPEFMEAITFELMCAIDIASSAPLVTGTADEIEADRRKREAAAIRAEAYRQILRWPVMAMEKVKRATKKNPEKATEYTPWVPQ